MTAPSDNDWRWPNSPDPAPDPVGRCPQCGTVQSSLLKADWNLAASVAMKADERADDLMRDVSDLCAKLDAANEALRTAREQWADALTRKERSEGSLKVQLECAEAAAEANRRDAERWHYMRDTYSDCFTETDDVIHHTMSFDWLESETLDAAIDAARASAKESER